MNQRFVYQLSFCCKLTLSEAEGHSFAFLLLFSFDSSSVLRRKIYFHLRLSIQYVKLRWKGIATIV